MKNLTADSSEQLASKAKEYRVKGVEEQQTLIAHVSTQHAEVKEELAGAKWHREHEAKSTRQEAVKHKDALAAELAELKEAITSCHEEVTRVRFLVANLQKGVKDAGEKADHARRQARDTGEMMRRQREEIFSEIATSGRAIAKQCANTESALLQKLGEERRMRELDLSHRMEEHRSMFEEALDTGISRIRRDMRVDIATNHQELCESTAALLKPMPSKLPPVVKECMGRLQERIVEEVSKKEKIVLQDRDEAADRLFSLMSTTFHHALRDQRDAFAHDMGFVMRQQAVDTRSNPQAIVRNPAATAEYKPNHHSRVKKAGGGKTPSGAEGDNRDDAGVLRKHTPSLREVQRAIHRSDAADASAMATSPREEDAL